MRRIVFVLLALMTLLITVQMVQAQDSTVDLTPPTFGEFDPTTVSDIDINNYPILPDLTDHAKAIYERGQAEGRNPDSFAKVGDCMTANAYFFAPFGQDDYDLGDYSDLVPVVERFSADPVLENNAFSHPSLAAANGFNTASVLDPIWSNPQYCDSDESPLTCEYRITNPSFSLIMFGTNDVFFIDAVSFDFYLRSIILETIDQNVIPVMSTFPTRPEFPDESVLYNQIILSIADDYDVPVVNLWLEIQDLPNEGVDELETIHLSIPEDGRTGDFTPDSLATGYTTRNLVMLQVLDKLWTDLDQG